MSRSCFPRGSQNSWAEEGVFFCQFSNCLYHCPRVSPMSDCFISILFSNEFSHHTEKGNQDPTFINSKRFILFFITCPGIGQFHYCLLQIGHGVKNGINWFFSVNFKRSTFWILYSSYKTSSVKGEEQIWDCRRLLFFGRNSR